MAGGVKKRPGDRGTGNRGTGAWQAHGPEEYVSVQSESESESGSGPRAVRLLVYLLPVGKEDTPRWMGGVGICAVQFLRWMASLID